MTVSDNTIIGEGVQVLFKNLGKKGPNVSKMMEKKRFQKPGTSVGYYS